MSERIAAAVWEKPRRRFGFGAVLTAFGLAVVLLVSGMSASSNAAPRAATGAGTGAAARRHRGSAAGDQRDGQRPAQADDRRREVRPARDGRPDHVGHHPRRSRSVGQGREIGSVLDLTGRRQHQSGPKCDLALQSRPRHPADLQPRRDPRLPDDVPGAAGRGIELGSRAGRERRVGLGRRGDRRRAQVDVQPDGRHRPRPPLGSGGRGRRRGSVSSARRSPPPRSAATRATTSPRRRRWPRPSSTSPHTAPRSRAANTTRSTCRPSSCSTTTCRHTRRRSTPARRP